MVLIFTNKEDSHPNFVIEHLADAGVPVFRLNTEALLTDYEFSWWADASACDFFIRCKASGLTVRGSEVTAVWDRRPEKPAELPVQNTTQINKHNLDEAFGFLYFIRYYLKDVPSIGSIANDRPASSKMLQLRYALEVGFKVPDTCFTNIKAAVTERLADDRDYVLKPIESDNVWDEAADSQWVFFAARTSAQNLREAPDEAYSQTVTFLQEYVDKAFELRVTVVGDRAFACRIDSQAQQDDTGKIDWRQGYGHGIRWSVFSLPEDISRKCFAYLRRMGLNFGCFDFIVTPSGEYVFLECNPNGQWLWVELETGLPISQAISEFLMNGKMGKFKLFIYEQNTTKEVQAIPMEQSISQDAKSAAYGIIEEVTGLEDGEYYADLKRCKNGKWEDERGMPTIAFNIVNGKSEIKGERIKFKTTDQKCD